MKTEESTKRSEDAPGRKRYGDPNAPMTAAGIKDCDEACSDFASDLAESGPVSEFRSGERVAFRQGTRRMSQRDGAAVDCGGEEGTVVGQSFRGAEDSKHAGKVCRGVIAGGELVTVPESDLRSRSGVSFSGLSAERWDAAFGKQKKKRGKK